MTRYLFNRNVSLAYIFQKEKLGVSFFLFYMQTDLDNGWKFAQCFGEKGEVEDVTDGI